jgi:hypothetical protein
MIFGLIPSKGGGTGVSALLLLSLPSREAKTRNAEGAFNDYGHGVGNNLRRTTTHRRGAPAVHADRERKRE